ncbi:MAG: 30S ribosomal protein S2 [Candidatus Moranbacteria bacterium CG06_land_8_20_14_3_00_40_12]|nr:MAG: 30S ribosomal protein S2 [Candidatus Moranbacteria bacterium CG23_combo_of_CG06-09_8_20_14_all_40_16]PIU80537.1 MAG: 30S ribosomal protein S2 [Candidatus Moranbacteria bacterium CG06_land_8_20_14_3_00_40_12]
MENNKNSALKRKKEPLSTGGEAVKDQIARKNDFFADFDFANLKVDIREMFKSGAHFGHQKARKNPKMNEYVFMTKNGINIINLQKTVEKLEEARNFIEKIISEGQQILFVGTKKQAKNIVLSLAKRCQMPYVVERWLGGTFTNFEVISRRVKFLRDGQEKLKRGEFSQYTKFEQMKIMEELESLEGKMGGIKNMIKLPGAIFLTGVIEDNLALKEAKIKKIPIIALVDTNVDPEDVDYKIPVNEDAISSLQLMLAYIGQAVLKGKEKIKQPEAVKK